jgi:hypothetical protein
MGLAWDETSRAHEENASHFCLTKPNVNCEIALIVVPWQENYGNVSPNVLDAARSAAERGIPLVLSLTWLRDDSSQLALPSGLSGGFEDAATRRAFVETAERLAARLKPAYFNLGEDVNRFASSHPDDFQFFPRAYEDAYKRIKDVSPLTKVFVSFQYESLIGLSLPAVPSNPPLRSARPEFVKAFDNRLDFVGISSDPSAYFPTPEAMPFNYYGFLSDRVAVPLFVIRVGWSGGNALRQSQQFTFVQRLVQTHYFLDTEAIIYARVQDDEEHSDGLITFNGYAKPAWVKWTEMCQYEWMKKK